METASGISSHEPVTRPEIDSASFWSLVTSSTGKTNPLFCRLPRGVSQHKLSPCGGALLHGRNCVIPICGSTMAGAVASSACSSRDGISGIMSEERLPRNFEGGGLARKLRDGRMPVTCSLSGASSPMLPTLLTLRLTLCLGLLNLNGLLVSLCMKLAGSLGFEPSDGLPSSVICPVRPEGQSLLSHGDGVQASSEPASTVWGEDEGESSLNEREGEGRRVPFAARGELDDRGTVSLSRALRWKGFKAGLAGGHSSLSGDLLFASLMIRRGRGEGVIEALLADCVYHQPA